MLQSHNVFRALTRAHRDMTTLLGFCGTGPASRRSPLRWLCSCSLLSPTREVPAGPRQRVALLQHSIGGPPTRALTVSAEQACHQSADAARRDGADSRLVAELPAPFVGTHVAGA